MGPRLMKELRPLSPTWCVLAVLAVVGFAVGSGHGMLPFFVIGGVALAVLPLGLEFEHRTLPFALSQPVGRSRLWWEKLRAATIAIGALAFVYAMLTSGLNLDGLMFWGMFILTTICSAGFFTLVSRSVIGGMVFTLFVELAGWIAINLIFELNVSNNSVPRQLPVAAWGVIALPYSALFLWLGWRKFVSLEITEAPSGRVFPVSSLITKGRGALLRCQPTGSLKNLVRKELCLQKPIFVIGVAFSISWLLAYVAVTLDPDGFFRDVFSLLIGVHLAMVGLLAGCISLGEEKTLGLAAWHLTLPVSARRQWFVKYLVAVVMTVLVGLLLPLLLARMTGVNIRPWLPLSVPRHMPLWIAVVASAACALSLWSVTLFGNTLRAVLGAILSLIGIVFCISVGARISNFYGLQTGIVTSLLIHFRLPPPDVLTLRAIAAYGLIPVILIVTFVMLAQSLSQFRRARAQSAVVIKFSALLAVAVLGGTFWFADMMRSLSRQSYVLAAEIEDPLVSFAEGIVADPNATLKWTIQDLEQTGRLSDLAKAWLKDTDITATFRRYPPRLDFPDYAQIIGKPAMSQPYRDRPGYYRPQPPFFVPVVEIRFPNGELRSFMIRSGW